MDKNNKPFIPWTGHLPEMALNMTLRDHFACVALTGLLASGKHSVYNAVETAYDAADRMMLQKEKQTQ